MSGTKQDLDISSGPFFKLDLSKEFTSKFIQGYNTWHIPNQQDSPICNADVNRNPEQVTIKRSKICNNCARQVGTPE